MILNDDEFKAIRDALDERSGLDPELLNRCSDFLRIGKYDEAVRNAFILLEERLRIAVNREKENMTGTQLAGLAFGPANGLFSKVLGNNDNEKQGLHEIYAGAFKLFRNPTAHGVVGYDRIEGKSIIGFVNLLLRILDKVSDLPPPNTFPSNLELTLGDMEKAIGPAATSRLRKFLGRCVTSGVKPTVASKQWIPFKRYALMKYDHWDKAKPHQLSLFYLYVTDKDRFLWFPINQYYCNVVDLDLESIKQELRSIGFQLFGKYQDYNADLKTNNSTKFFDQLFDIVIDISKDLETRLEQA